MLSSGKTSFERFVEEFALRYMREFEIDRDQSIDQSPEEAFCFLKEKMLLDENMLRLFCEYKTSGKTPEQWFEDQEQS